MKSYSLKLSGREEGPYAESQIAQMVADGRIDRNTPCKPADRGDWKTIDDYLSMLKYGTKLPPSAAFLLRNRHRFCGTLLQIALRNKYRQTKRKTINFNITNILAAEIVEDLQAALAQFAEIPADLKR